MTRIPDPENPGEFLNALTINPATISLPGPLADHPHK